jgi:hypothetical protein
VSWDKHDESRPGSKRERGAEKSRARPNTSDGEPTHRVQLKLLFGQRHFDGRCATGIFLEYKENDKKTKRYQKIFQLWKTETSTVKSHGQAMKEYMCR